MDEVPVGVIGWSHPLVHLIDDDRVPGDRLRSKLGEHRPRGVAAADREVEAAASRYRVAGALGHERRPGPGHGVGVGQGFELMVHVVLLLLFFSAWLAKG